ncbi:hypothetical protein MPH_08227 [Macrophomina phaseolina MS6]|uniref:Zn(2)-C6 fungal-type domain-containing protein n=1 Tax=Macrophomina phaseolina (strain MS6) TaxID=1126212 RepID=K2RPB1_MACPH|nr:hypothetical protein MPH_08227 [Macrophomina phaseolina MS6]
MTRSSSESAVRDAGVRKRMRKGTHSCFECRRRKIRCIFSDDHPGECTECFARGSRCIDQEHADPEAIVDNRKNLRERVAKLEALIESLLDDQSSAGAAETLRKLGAEVSPPTPRSEGSSATPVQQTAPVMSMFDNDVLSRSLMTKQTSGITTKQASSGLRASRAQVYSFPGIELSCECDDIGIPKVKKSKEKRTRETLLSVLPSRELVEKAVKEGDDLWRILRHKLHGTTRGRTFQQFATHALGEGTPPELGVFLLSVGAALDLNNIDQTLALVDALIISDDEYAATIEGMECSIMVAKCYSDIGQPRRAWLTARKGLMYAQLMGLHRCHASNAVWDSIWWGLYQTDRFLSLMLGLPYSIPDAHVDMHVHRQDGEPGQHREFLLKISVLASKVIDRTQTVHEPSLASALEVDHELDALAESMPADWSETQNQILSSIDPVQTIYLRERLLGQICYQQLRVYLHLPFMLKSASASNASKFAYSRSTCFSASRELLRLYHFLRGGNGDPLYECKVIDFLGFTAAVLIMLGLLGYARVSTKDSADDYHNVVQEEQDWRLIEITMDIFGRASTEKGGKVASQSLKVLQQLSSARGYHMLNDAEECSVRVVIPYFGTITISKGKKFHINQTNAPAAPTDRTPSNVTAPRAPGTGHSASPSVNPQQGFLPSPTQTTNQNSSTNSISGESNGANNPNIAYDPFLFPGPLDPSASAWPAGQDGIDSLMGIGHGGPWYNIAANLDIDQDWNWFMTGAQTGGAQFQGQQSAGHSA